MLSISARTMELEDRRKRKYLIELYCILSLERMEIYFNPKIHHPPNNPNSYPAKQISTDSNKKCRLLRAPTLFA